MGKATTVKGKDLMLFMGGKATALATGHTLKLTADTTDTASKDSGIWDESEITKKSWEASTSALYSADAAVDSYEVMFDAFIAGTAVDIVMGIPTNKADELPTTGWTVPAGTAVRYAGKALITSLDLNANNGDKASYTASFKGVGALAKVNTAS